MRAILVVLVALVAVSGCAKNRTTEHETSLKIAQARCAVAKRCWPDRSRAACELADTIKGQPDERLGRGLYTSDLAECVSAVEKAECSRVQPDLVQFMTSEDNAACHGYRDYYGARGRYASPKP